MAVRVGINGFGRMGRLALPAGWGRPDLQFVHINEVAGGPEIAAHLLTFDSVIPLGLRFGASPSLTMLGGLGLFGVVFALNSAVRSYMVLAYSEAERASLSVGFYDMANAAGRLMGTLLSGVLYQLAGVTAALWGAVVLAAIAGIVAMFLPPVATVVSWAAAKGDD